MPCRNPSCSSNGKPHPNCRCYPNLMAEGGEVKFRCEGAHQPGCEHYLANPPSDADNIAAAFAHHGAVGALKPISADDHMSAVRKGNAKISASLKTLFADPKSLNRAAPDVKAREKLADHLANGGIVQGLKDGDSPALEDTSMAEHYPAQNILMQASRAGREGYLNSLRPEEQSIKLPFDDEPDQTEPKRVYHQALDAANDPLSVIPEIGHGTLEESHVKHLSAMAPELTDLLKSKMTQKVMKTKMKGDNPTYHVRQSMILFMGSDLSSELRHPQALPQPRQRLRHPPRSRRRPRRRPKISAARRDSRRCLRRFDRLPGGTAAAAESLNWAFLTLVSPADPGRIKGDPPCRPGPRSSPS